MRLFLLSLSLGAMLPGVVSGAGELSAVTHLDEAFPRENTVVWTPLFQAAWDRMNKDLGGKPVKIEPPSELMAKLDDFQWTATEVMPPLDRWRVWSGPATSDFVENVNREAAQILGEEKGPFDAVDAERPSGSRLILALLDRDLEYPRAFVRSASSHLAFKDASGQESKVKFFGTLGKLSGSYSDSVRILHQDEASHAVQLATNQQGEAVVLYLPKEPESFATACEKLKGWRVDGLKGKFGSALDPQLHEKDDLRIPVVEFSLLSDFTPLLGGNRFYTERGVPMFIAKAEQKVDFQMTEKGAKVEAKVELKTEPFSASPEVRLRLVPRKFVYDRPFFVFMWREGAALPYAGVWVGGTNSLRVAK